MVPYIAIHERKGSFSDRWVKVCKDKQLSFRTVNCYNSDIIKTLSNFNVLLWHWSHEEAKNFLIARAIISSVENMGLRVFPNISTCWHYDDKIAQKYLLEAIGAPLVPTYVFYNKEEAFRWISSAAFPKVFKLRRGAGSENVRLVRDYKDAQRLCRIAFRKGFSPVQSLFHDSRVKVKKIRNLKDLFSKVRNIGHAVANTSERKSLMPLEKGYVYFQDYIPNNRFDTRVTIIGNRAFACTRNVRKNDFRASGSGDIVYDINKVNLDCVKIAFDITRDLKTQSLAFDFLSDRLNKPLITEISYCYVSSCIYNCPGYWDPKFNWHERHIWPEDAILEDLI
ncbi:MAG: hypothetical protein PHW54_00600 [Candidatus Omnitrophica bacterium]|nr:hypothetical protein [Candidatus Omnitrophota bacterium]